MLSYTKEQLEKMNCKQLSIIFTGLKGKDRKMVYDIYSRKKVEEITKYGR